MTEESSSINGVYELVIKPQGGEFSIDTTGEFSTDIDNNLAENAIRPFVIGRKKRLFSNSQRGATANANLYNLIGTEKANAQEPYQYLSWSFERVPKTAPSDYASLMLWEMPPVPNL